MNPRQIFWLSVVGLAIGGADGYWQIHSAGPYLAPFYLGLAFAAVAPVGSYFIGLSQSASRQAAVAQKAEKDAQQEQERIAALRAKLDVAAGR